MLLERFEACRQTTRGLCAPLTIEDHVVQPAAFVSPPKWHLAHTTWFFENFVLKPSSDLPWFDSSFSVLFNSYYKSQGLHWQQSERGTLSRPSVDEVNRYRDHLDLELCQRLSAGQLPNEALSTINLGIHHEQQHQELLLMDIKAVLATNPTLPAYVPVGSRNPNIKVSASFVGIDAGRVSIGSGDPKTFTFDNELPRHEVMVRPFELATALVTNQQYLEFIEDNGYDRPELWLSDGWDVVRQNRWDSPRYWFRAESRAWHNYTLNGATKLDPNAPVAHVSFYEADAFARWSNARLPTEAEWEHAASRAAISGSFLESDNLGPRASSATTAAPETELIGMHGELWQWTQSPYVAYPGYRQPAGAFGEYNGKFMCNQMVLRGGCFATPRSHYRITYRNFYKPEMRWQFGGIRLARDA